MRKAPGPPAPPPPPPPAGWLDFLERQLRDFSVPQKITVVLCLSVLVLGAAVAIAWLIGKWPAVTLGSFAVASTVASVSAIVVRMLRR